MNEEITDYVSRCVVCAKFHNDQCKETLMPHQSCPRVGWTRGSGRVGSRFCRILVGRVGSGPRKVTRGQLCATRNPFQTIRKNSGWLDGAEVSASGWGSGGPRFQSHPRLTFQSCSRYQLNQLRSKAASESTVKKSNTCGVSNTRLYFFL